MQPSAHVENGKTKDIIFPDFDLSEFPISPSIPAYQKRMSAQKRRKQLRGENSAPSLAATPETPPPTQVKVKVFGRRRAMKNRQGKPNRTAHAMSAAAAGGR